MGELEQKVCNALIVDAVVNERKVRNPITLGVLACFKAKAGGLWVGGTITLHDDILAFRPNAMNVELHEGDCAWQVPLRAIRSVEPRFGVGTGIVDLRTTDGTRTFRCFGAKSFAASIKARASRHAPSV